MFTRRKAMGESSRQPNTPENAPDTGQRSLVDVGRKAATITERLCGLYVMVTMNMDFSLIKYYVQNGELRKWLKQCFSGEPAQV